MCVAVTNTGETKLVSGPVSSKQGLGTTSGYPKKEVPFQMAQVVKKIIIPKESGVVSFGIENVNNKGYKTGCRSGHILTHGKLLAENFYNKIKQ